MRTLGIDYGDSRIGVALSDGMGWTAQSLCVIDGKKSRKNVLSEITSIVEKNQVDTIVVGYPLNMNGSVGPRAEITDAFIKDLQGVMSSIKMVKWDERLTSKAANNAMKEMGIKQSRKGMNDLIAAVFILQGYLDSKYHS